MIILEVLQKVWINDVATITYIFNQWWHWLIFPVLFYGFYFSLKWALLTLPAWLPVVLILRGLPIKVPIRFTLPKK